MKLGIVISGGIRLLTGDLVSDGRVIDDSGGGGAGFERGSGIDGVYGGGGGGGGPGGVFFSLFFLI